MTKDLETAIPQICYIPHGVRCQVWSWGIRRREGTVKSLESTAYGKPTCSIVKGGSGIFFFLPSLLYGVSEKERLEPSQRTFCS